MFHRFIGRVLMVLAALCLLAPPTFAQDTLARSLANQARAAAQQAQTTALAAQRSYLTNARALVTSAQRPLGDLTAVMAVPPTISAPGTGANSTIISTSTCQAGGGRYNAENPLHVTVLGGPINSGGSFPGRILTVTRDATTQLQGHSSGVAFTTMAAAVDICMRVATGQRWIAYVTDANGVRARIAAADLTATFTSRDYYKLDFGSRALRTIEFYGDSQGAFSGINVALGDSIWPASTIQPRIAFLGDSWFFGQMNDATVQLKLAVPDWYSGFFGVANPHVNGITGTGAIATSGSGYYTFGQRVPDLDAARIGPVAMVVAPGSINDNNPTAGGIAAPGGDATVQAAYQASTAALMIAQPNAIIVGYPQQWATGGGNAVATRAAAYKAGFLAAAGSDPRMIWLDNTPFLTTADTGALGADGNHPGGIVGARYVGERLARMVLERLRPIVVASNDNHRPSGRRAA